MNQLISKLALLTLLLINTATINILIPSRTALSQPVQREKEIREYTKAVTVQIEGSNPSGKQGTGVIIQKFPQLDNNNDYIVLTNRHNVDENINEYKITTVDGKVHIIDRKDIHSLDKADIAFIFFRSENSYDAASRGDSRTLEQGDIIHYGGYPSSSSTPFPEKTYYFYINERIRTILSKNDIGEDGYQLVITGEALSGLSGSGIFNNKGELIAIYSGTGLDPITLEHSILAIPINIAIELGEEELYKYIYKNFISPSQPRKPFPPPKINEETASSYKDKGDYYLKNEEWYDALDAYNKVIQLKPNDAYAYYDRGNSYRELAIHQSKMLYHNQSISNIKKAISDFNQTITIDPNLVKAYIGRGDSYSFFNKYEEAFADYNQAIAIDPNYALAYKSRGNLHLRLDEYQKALADYNQAIAIDSNLVDVYLGRSAIYMANEQPHKALNELNKAIAVDPNYAFAYFVRGELYRVLHEPQKAINDYKKALNLSLRQGDGTLAQQAKTQLTILQIMKPLFNDTK